MKKLVLLLTVGALSFGAYGAFAAHLPIAHEDEVVDLVCAATPEQGLDTPTPDNPCED